MDVFLPLLLYDDPEDETVVPAPGTDKDLSGNKFGVQRNNEQAHVVAQSAVSPSPGHGSATDASSDSPAVAAGGQGSDFLRTKQPKSSGKQNPNPVPGSHGIYSTCTSSAAGSATIGTPAIRRAADATTTSAKAGCPSPGPSHSSSSLQCITTCSSSLASSAPASADGVVASNQLTDGAATLGTGNVGGSRHAVANDAKNKERKETDREKEEEVPPLDSLDDFEARRRRAVFTAMLLLLEHGARDAEHLSHLVAAMSGEELQQVAEERALAGRCGNPLCDAVHFVAQSPPPRRRWDPFAGFVEPPPPSHFCSAGCELLIESYASQLGDNPLERLKPGVREMLAVSHVPRRPGLENVAAQGGGVPTMMAEIRERDPTAAVAEAVAAGQELESLAAAACADCGGGGGSSGAVEGYTPRAERSRKPLPVDRPQFSAGATPPNLKPSLRKQSSLMVSKGGGGQRIPKGSADIESEAATTAVTVAPGAVPAGREQKRVTFGPKIEYQMPAQLSRRKDPASSQAASRPTEQSVLVFDVDEDGADGGGSGGGGTEARAGRQHVPRQGDAAKAEAQVAAAAAVGLRGTLRVAEAAELVQEAVEAEAGWSTVLTDEELAATMREKAVPSAVPRAMKLWFPPAAGGTGISRRTAAAGAAQRQRQRQRQRSKPTVQAAGAPPPPDPAATDATSTATAPPSSRPDRNLATTACESAASASKSSGHATEPELIQDQTRNAVEVEARSGASSRTRAEAEGGLGPLKASETAATGAGTVLEVGTGTGSGRTTGQGQPFRSGLPASASGGLRRFLPNTGKNRRKVVFLDTACSGREQGQVQGRGREVGWSWAQEGEEAMDTAVKAVAPAAPIVAVGLEAAAGGPTEAATESPTHKAHHPMTEAIGERSREEAAPSARDPATASESYPLLQETPAAVSASTSIDPKPGKALRNTGWPVTDPWAPWAQPPPGSAGASSGTSNVHVVHIRSDKRSAGGGVPIPPENQPYFPEEEGGGEEGEEHELEEEQFAHDDRDADELADELYAGTLAGADEEVEVEELGLEGGLKEHEVEERTGRGGRGISAKLSRGLAARSRQDRRGARAAGNDGSVDGGRGSWWKMERQRQQQQSRKLQEEQNTRVVATGMAAAAATTVAATSRGTASVLPQLLQPPMAAGAAGDAGSVRESTGGATTNTNTAAVAHSVRTGDLPGSADEPSQQLQQQPEPGQCQQHQQASLPMEGVLQGGGRGEGEVPDIPLPPPDSSHRVLSVLPPQHPQSHHLHHRDGDRDSQRQDRHHNHHPDHSRQEATSQEVCGDSVVKVKTYADGAEDTTRAATCSVPTLSAGTASPSRGGAGEPEPGLGPGSASLGAEPAAEAAPPPLALSCPRAFPQRRLSVEAAAADNGGGRDADGGDNGHEMMGGDECNGNGGTSPVVATSGAGIDVGLGACDAGDPNGGADSAEGEADGLIGEGEAALEPWMLRDDLDSLSGDDDDGGSSASSSADDCNYTSMLPYFHRTTQHYHTVLSPYNQVQTALVGWVNSRTVAFVVGIGLGPLQDPGPALSDGEYAEEGAEGVPTTPVLQARGVLLQLLAGPVRECCSQLAVRVAQSDLDRKLTALVSSFRLSGPVPSFKQPQWMLLSLALLHALSVHHIPALRTSLCAPPPTPAASGAAGIAANTLSDAGNAPAPPPLRAGGVLRSHPRLVAFMARIGFDVHYLSALVDLLTSPEF